MPSPLPSLLDAELGFDIDDLTFWQSRLRGGALILGAGTGRLAGLLAARGLRCLGLESDPELLAAARRRSAEAPLARADLARFAARGFGCAFVLFPAYQSLPDRAARLRLLACAAGALGADGYLTLDLLFLPARSAAASPRRLAAEFAWEDTRVAKFESWRRAGDRVELRWEYLAGGRPLADRTWSLALLDRKTVEAELRDAGFQPFALWRDYHERRFEDRGPRLIVEAARG